MTDRVKHRTIDPSLGESPRLTAPILDRHPRVMFGAAPVNAQCQRYLKSWWRRRESNASLRPMRPRQTPQDKAFSILTKPI